MAHVGIDAVLIDQGDGSWDFELDEFGDIRTASFFDTAILTSLFTDRRALASQIVTPEFRRGWIGNEDTLPEFELGSWGWLYEQSRLDRTTRNGLADAAKGALSWLVADGFAIAVRTSTLIVNATTLALRVEIDKPNGDVEVYLYTLWENTGESFAD